MKSDIVLVTAIICLALLGIVASFAFSEGVARIFVGGAMTAIGTICGVNIHITIRELRK